MLANACLWTALLSVALSASAGQHVVIVLDDSGSMKDPLRNQRGVRKIDAAKTALHTVLEQLPEDAHVGLLVLNGGDRGWIFPLARSDKRQINAAIQGIRASGGTPLGQAMKTAADALLAARAQQHYGSYRLLIVTDGEAGDRDLVERYLPDIVARGLSVDVIGVDMAQDHSLATQVQTYRRADDLNTLRQALADVVLGESSADTGDAGESDFELLAALPDDVASAALDALSQTANQPIGQDGGTAVPHVDSPSVFPPWNQSVHVPASSPDATRRPGASSPLSALLGACCCGVVTVGLLMGVGLMMVLRKRT